MNLSFSTDGDERLKLNDKSEGSHKGPPTHLCRYCRGPRWNNGDNCKHCTGLEVIQLDGTPETLSAEEQRKKDFMALANLREYPFKSSVATTYVSGTNPRGPR